MKKILLICLLGFCVCSYTNAQNTIPSDTIFMRNQTRIVCKIIEIGDDEIRYLLSNSDVVLGMDKNDISKVTFSTGTSLVFVQAIDDPSKYAGQKKNAIKFRLFSPLSGFSEFSYERSLKPGVSFESSVSLIGLGSSAIYEGKGIGIRSGYKFIKKPDYYMKGMRYAHLLKGSYFKPEIALAFHDEVIAGAILLNVGKQWILNDTFLVDWFVGFGYGFSNEVNYDEDNSGFHFGFSAGPKEIPLALTSGFKIGFLIK